MKFYLCFSIVLCTITISLQRNSHGFRRGNANLAKNTKTSGRIINGEEAIPHSIPFQVFLNVTASDGHWVCGGSLISQSYVLTAAHCIDRATNVDIFLGIHRISDATESTRQVLKANRLIVHEGFDEDTITYDIGLIKLSSAATLNHAVSLVILPSRDDQNESYVGNTATVSGWGLTDGYSTSVSDVLMEVATTVISNEECLKSYSLVQDYQLCTIGEHGKGSCSGDSGGPLVIEGKQIGVVSYGEATCQPGYPAGFTRTTSFLDWIQDNSDVVIN